jgi:hypothetical protein
MNFPSNLTLILATVLCCTGSPLQASIVYGNLDATIISTSADGTASLPSGLDVGDILSVSFQYYSDAISDGVIPYTNELGIAQYGTGLNLSMSISGGGLTWEGSGGVAAVMDGWRTSNDRFDLELRESYGAMFSSFPEQMGSDSYIAFALSDILAPLELTNSLALPQRTSDLNLDAAHNNAVVISSNTVGAGNWIIVAEPDLVTLRIVPEPTSTALLALGGLAMMMRRKR